MPGQTLPGMTVPGQNATINSRYHWVVNPPSKENHIVVGTQQKIRYFGVIEVRPIPDVENLSGISCTAMINGPDGQRMNSALISYDKGNPVFSFMAIPRDLSNPDTHDMCRFILLRHISFPSAGVYVLQLTVQAHIVSTAATEVPPPLGPQIEKREIDRITVITVEVKDGETWDERRSKYSMLPFLSQT